MGVWIETDNQNVHNQATEVTPCMGVWIETFGQCQKKWGLGVTPCMGVWIETAQVRKAEEEADVTPCMGVWIETNVMGLHGLKNKSHPVWVCGLKHHSCNRCRKVFSHTLYGCVD